MPNVAATARSGLCFRVGPGAISRETVRNSCSHQHRSRLNHRRTQQLTIARDQQDDAGPLGLVKSRPPPALTIENGRDYLVLPAAFSPSSGVVVIHVGRGRNRPLVFAVSIVRNRRQSNPAQSHSVEVTSKRERRRNRQFDHRSFNPLPRFLRRVRIPFIRSPSASS